MVFRFAALILLPLLAYVFLLFNLYELQLVNGGPYRARAGSEVAALRFLKANRGSIYFTDRGSNLLPAVLNKDFPLIYAAPEAVEDPSEAANILAPILDRSVENLEVIFSKDGDVYELLARRADQELVKEIRDLNLQGIYIDAEPGRYYPLGSLASHLLGFVGPSGDSMGDAGRYGLEAFYEEKLAGEHGKVFDSKVVKPSPGEDLVLTIDPNIQIEAERILSNLVKNYSALGGSVIVLDPQTGRVLALGSLPNFDPNSYGAYPISNFLNPVTQQIYEPGSVFKVLTMAAGIDSGSITPETTYYDKGTLTLNGRTISNYDLKKNGPYGRVSMATVLEHSINTGAVFAQRQIGRELFAEYLHNFGLAERTGVDLPGEIRGDLRRLSPKERDIAFATAAYGQGVAVTPIELITAISVIANGGKLMRPYLDSSLEPVVIRRVISADTARQVTEMMVSAVDKARVAKIKGYTIAGKTGTANVPDFKYGGYTDNVINTYIGFGPASDPRFVALVKMNEPKGAPLAGLSVVPAFRDLAQFILNYYGVSPDRL